MNLVKEYSEIQRNIASIKDLKKHYITNFYENENEVSSWIDARRFYTDTFGEVELLFRKNDGFYNLFYVAATSDAVEEALKTMLKKNPKIRFVSDIVTKKEAPEIKNRFENSGFYEYSSLMRMNRMNQFHLEDYTPDNNTRVADADEFQQVFKLLHEYFDPLSEQLPTKEKLMQWIDNKNVLVNMIEKRVVGFIIYELIGKSLYLKYWFVSPYYREQKIGSKLFQLFLYMGSTSKRQVFWVVRSNKNAIKRYKHYGFKEDKTYDFIMMNKI